MIGVGFGQELTLEYFSTDQGLPDDIIYKITQTQDGRIWLGTDNGLSRYDGSFFKNYGREEGLTSVFVTGLLEIDSGKLLLGTWKGGFHIYEKDTIYYPPNNKPRINIASVDMIDGKYIGWSSHAFFQATPYVDSLSISFKKPFTLKDKRLGLINPWNQREKTLSELRNAKYFVSDDQKLWVYRSFPDIRECQPDSILTPISHSTAKDTIYSLTKDPEGQLWAGGNGYLFKLSDPDRLFTKNLSGLTLDKFVFTSPSSLFFYSGSEPDFDQRNVYEYNIQTGKLHELDAFLGLNSIVSDIFIDQELNFWVASNGAGVRRVRYPYAKKIATGIKSSYVRGIDGDKKGKVYISTLSQGVFKVNPIEIEEIIKYAEVKNIVSSVVGNNGDLLISTLNDGCIINEEKIYPNPISHSLPMNDHTWVLITNNTIGLLQKNEGYFICENVFNTKGNYDLGSGFIDANNSLWIATNQGLLRLDLAVEESKEESLLDCDDIRSNLRHEFITKEDGLLCERILNVQPGVDSSLWILSELGLSQYKGGKFLHFNDDRIWPSTNGVMVLDNNGVVWIGSKKGLVYFYKNQFGIFDKKDGLVSDEITALYVDELDQLWVGGIHGVAIIDVTDPPVFQSPPVTQIQGIQINRRSVFEDESVLSYGDSIRFLVGTNSTLTPGELDIRVRLGERNWQLADQGFVMYQGLNPGTYQFHVSSRYANGIWGEPQKHVFRVKPPWWDTTWMKLLYIIGVLFSFIGSVHFVKKTNQKKYSQKLWVNQKISEMELKALQAQMNPHFIFNALNSIQRLMIEGDELKTNKYLTGFSRLMRLYLESSRSEFSSLEEEIEMIRLYIDLEMLRFKNKLACQLKVDPELDLQVDFPTMILQPFVENAINHGLLPKSGEKKLEVLFEKNGGNISCTIDDNGVGRSYLSDQLESGAHKPRATQIVVEKLEVLKSAYEFDIQLEIIDKIDKLDRSVGTRVVIQTPLS